MPGRRCRPCTGKRCVVDHRVEVRQLVEDPHRKTSTTGNRRVEKASDREHSHHHSRRLVRLPAGPHVRLLCSRRPPAWSSTGLAAVTGQGTRLVSRLSSACRNAAWSAAPRAQHPAQRVIPLVGGARLRRDYRVFGDLDVGRTDLGAALGDALQAQALPVAASGQRRRASTELRSPEASRPRSVTPPFILTVWRIASCAGIPEAGRAARC